MNTVLADSSLLDVFLPLLGVLIFAALLIGVAIVLRKRYVRDHAGDAAGGFSLGGLRELVKQGKMTQEEYDRAKEQIVAAMHKRQAEKAAEAQAKSKTPQPPFSLE